MTKELSIFIDESGDFGEYDPKSPYYIIGMVIHNQEDNLTDSIKYLNKGLSETKLERNFVHIGPLIRKELGYKHMAPEDRARILWRVMSFVRKAPFTYKTFMVEKKHIKNDTELIEKLARKLSDFIIANYPYFLSFDKIKIYYDNGQTGVMKIIITVFTTLFRNAEFRRAAQKDYKMLQVADLVCTAELASLKMAARTLSRSERRLLGTDRDINKNLLKPLRKKEFKNK